MVPRLVLMIVLCLASSAGQGTPPPAAPAFDDLARRAAAAREAGRLQEALGLYRKALALNPSWAEGWWYTGTLLYDNNIYPEAAQAFRKAAALTPKDGTPLVMLGLCEFALGQDAPALEHIQQGNRIGISEDDHLRQVVFYHEARLLQSKAKFENAQQILHSLCLSGVQTPEVANTLGMAALRMTGRSFPPDGTREALIVNRVGRAQCLGAQKKYDQARIAYRALIDEYKDYPNLHYAYGRFLLEASDRPAAIVELKREIASRPGHVMARLEIASAHYKVDSAAGLPYAEEAVKLNPQLPMGRYLLGLLLLETDNYLRAIPELELARKAFPGEPKIHLALGSAYARAGRHQDAARARTEFQRLSQASAAAQ